MELSNIKKLALLGLVMGLSSAQPFVGAELSANQASSSCGMPSLSELADFGTTRDRDMDNMNRDNRRGMSDSRHLSEMEDDDMNSGSDNSMGYDRDRYLSFASDFQSGPGERRDNIRYRIESNRAEREANRADRDADRANRDPRRFSRQDDSLADAFSDGLRSERRDDRSVVDRLRDRPRTGDLEVRIRERAADRQANRDARDDDSMGFGRRDARVERREERRAGRDGNTTLPIDQTKPNFPRNGNFYR